MLEIAVIGTGYVGLSTGACLAHLGHDVTCVDIDSEKVQMLSAGKIPIVEAGLKELVEEGLTKNNLRFTADLRSAVKDTRIVFLCVPTPQADDGSADLSSVWAAVSDVAPLLPPNSVLVNKSTVPVGTALLAAEIIARDDIAVVSNPEFLRQGTAVRDFLQPSRIVVGGSNPVAVDLVASLYAEVDAPILRMSAESAETLKYAANSLLATKLTFINAMADICEVVGADIFEVAAGIGLDPRIGRDMLNAGPGWGGSCFPKDTRALVKIAEQGGYDFALLRGVIETNDGHYERIAQKVVSVCGGSVDGLTVAGWGLTFKAGTDDLRDSPAIKILSILHRRGARIQAHDPTARGQYLGHEWIQVKDSPLDACSGADVLVVLTEWSSYREISPIDVKQKLSAARIVDGRNVLDRESWRDAGFDYRGVGR